MDFQGNWATLTTSLGYSSGLGWASNEHQLGYCSDSYYLCWATLSHQTKHLGYCSTWVRNDWATLTSPGAGEFGCRYGHFWCFTINKPSNIWTRPIPQAQSNLWACPGCWGRPQPAHQVPAPPAARELDYEPWNWHGQVFLSSWVDLYTVGPFWREQFFNMNIFQRL